MEGQTRDEEEKEKTDQSQQTTPTTPPSSGKNFFLYTFRYLVSWKTRALEQKQKVCDPTE